MPETGDDTVRIGLNGFGRIGRTVFRAALHDDRVDIVVAEQYLELLKGLIVADANVSPLEYELFQILCEHWGGEMDMPTP